jgi:aspartyl-tRNA(Asn)/glutamyl-tRNA(Gln) amidotransferase subunit A
MKLLAQLSASELGPLYQSGALSPVEVARDTLARIDAVEPQVNAFIHRDPDETLRQATASERRWKAGEPLSPLDGVPVTIKDNLVVAGWPIRRGTTLSPATPAPEDSPCTARLREAGAVILGKTTMPEYGWKGVGDSPLSGITRNPWNLATGPGGSSAGAAVAAALNLGCIHLGTDGAGSVRIPAAFTGVFGLKPSYGRVPAWPASTMGFLAHIGPLTRTVRDAALAMSCIGQPDSRDMTALVTPCPDYLEGLEDGVSGLRIGWSPRLGQDVVVDPEVAALTQKAAGIFGTLGAHVDAADPGFADPIDILMTIWSAGAAMALKDTSAADRLKMDPGLVAVAEAGEKVSGAAYVEALLFQRNVLSLTMARYHEKYDLLLTPSLAIPAFETGRNTPVSGAYGEDWTRWTPFSYPFNITQAPAASIPCGLTRAGLPVGLQIVGPMGADALVLRAARAFEKAMPFARIDAPKA